MLRALEGLIKVTKLDKRLADKMFSAEGKKENGFGLSASASLSAIIRLAN